MEGGGTEPGLLWFMISIGSVNVPKLHDLIRRATQQPFTPPLITDTIVEFDIRKAFNDTIVGFNSTSFGLAPEIPDLDFAVAGTGGHAGERGGIFGEGVDAVDVPIAKLCEKGFRKEAVELSSVKGAGIFACAFEGMESGVEVAGLGGGVGALGGVDGGGAGEGFDFLGRALKCVEI